MSKFVSFSVTDGGVVGKARKRLRGDNNRKAEVKKCDQNGSVQYPFLTCVCNYLHNVPSTQQLSTYLYNHAPLLLKWPNNGNYSYNFIGNSIFLKFFRFKGYLLSKVTNPVQVRWRLCLCRLDISGVDSPTFNTDSYLSLYKDFSCKLTSQMNSFDNTVTGAAINFYSKQKDVDEWSGIKRVVIASGVLPPSTTFHREYGYVTHTASGNTDIGANEINSTNGVDNGGADVTGYRGYTPVDVKVTLNDRINVQKNLVKYYLVFESDCGLGYPLASAVAGGGQNSAVEPRVDWPSESPIQIQLQCMTYYTDA